MPKVSVIMSVFNGEKFIQEAIASILRQTFSDFEFLIIDDGSTDATVEMIEAFTDQRLKLLKRNHRGISASVNEGISAATGELIARMDADDISLPERLEREVEFLENNPDFVMVGSAGMLIDEAGLPLGMVDKPADLGTIQDNLNNGILPFFNGSSVFRKAAAEKCGLYDERLNGNEDWYLATKLVKLGKLTNLALVLYQYRFSRLAITNLSPSLLKKRKAIMQKIVKTGTISVEDARIMRELKQKLSPRELTAQYYFNAGKALISYDWQPKRARPYLLNSLYSKPFDLRCWFNLFLSFMPAVWVKAWRNYRTA
jgi:glycosyltransferase involved in cell wall biosynthesis